MQYRTCRPGALSLLPAAMIVFSLLFGWVAATQPADRFLSLSVTGDLMVHQTQLQTAAADGALSNQAYDFFPSFAEIAPYLQAADMTVGNLETTIGEAAEGFSGYPLFKTPAEWVDALQKAGFDLLTTANNHGFDGGKAGIERTLACLKQRGLLHTGLREREADWGQPLYTDRNGICIAHFAFAHYLNRNEWKLGKEASWRISRIDDPDFERRLDPIVKEARQKADFLVAYVHWGDEYSVTPNQQQEAWEALLCRMGFNLIVGSHPHVLQPVKWMESPSEAKGTGNQPTLIFESMGNFIAHMGHEIHPNTDVGLIATVTLRKSRRKGFTRIEKAELQPTWVAETVEKQPTGSKFLYRLTVLPLLTADDGFWKKQFPLNAAQYRRITEANAFYGSLFGGKRIFFPKEEAYKSQISE